MKIRTPIIGGILSSAILLSNPAYSDTSNDQNSPENLFGLKETVEYPLEIRRDFDGRARGLGIYSLNSSNNISTYNIGVGNTLTFGSDYFEVPSRGENFIRTGLDIGRGFYIDEGYVGGFTLGVGGESRSPLEFDPHFNAGIYLGNDNFGINFSARGLQELERFYGQIQLRF